MSIKNKTKLLLSTPLLLGLLSFQAYAKTPANADLARIAHPPHKIKPHVSALVASGLTPAQVKQAYGFNNLPYQGQGQTIAIIDAYDNPNAESDLGVFSTQFGLPACTTANGCFQKVFSSGARPQGNLDWGIEIALDVQWAHAMAPQAKIMLVEAPDASFGSLLNGVTYAVQHGANVVSMSWGGSEFSGETALDSTFSASNVTFVAAAGDNGTGPIYPSVSPNVIAVGGTTLSIDAVGNYLGEIAWSDSGGGMSAYEPEPAYQSSFGIPNNPNQNRGVPDVTYAADPNNGFSIYDTFGYLGWFVVGGTSAGTPQWAGLVADAKSATHKPITGVNNLLYSSATKNYSLTYNDVTSGTNGACGYYCTAQQGYDYVTGLGSPQAQFLAYDLIYYGLRS